MDLLGEIGLEVMVDRVDSISAKGTQSLDTSLPPNYGRIRLDTGIHYGKHDGPASVQGLIFPSQQVKASSLRCS
jgi:hypothetical protein